jgi:prepilin-type processing-associated H-X9-DG protein
MIAIADSRETLDVGLSVSKTQGENRLYPYSMTLVNPLGEVSRTRHGGGRVNVGFVDGHVESIRRVELLRPTESMRKRWNADNQPHRETWNP